MDGGVSAKRGSWWRKAEVPVLAEGRPECDGAMKI